jgi:POT family proton-dependent oligopeptide transporter
VSTGSGRREQTWFGQPRGLTILFLTQMWELFSYYGMRALLVYYMTKQLLFAQEKASFIYGTYTAMAYFTPILGGAIADRWLGKRNAVTIGGAIVALGHFLMAFEAGQILLNQDGGNAGGHQQPENNGDQCRRFGHREQASIPLGSRPV